MGLSTTSLPPEITRLRQLWRRFSLMSLFFLLGGALLLGAAWESRYALRWLALSSPILAYLIVVFRMGLSYNHRPEEARVLPTLGAGNLMTLGRGVLLANPDWIEPAAFTGLDVLSVDPAEPRGANTRRVGDTVVMADGFPRTRARIEQRGFVVRVVSLTELQKAEAGGSCMSLIFPSWST